MAGVWGCAGLLGRLPCPSLGDKLARSWPALSFAVFPAVCFFQAQDCPWGQVCRFDLVHTQ